jgi:signal transduction histidine kinase
MHALGLFSDSLRRRIAEPSQQALAQRICESVEALEQTFDALLDISRLDAGVVQAKPQTFALRALFERVANDCAHEAAAKGLALRVLPTGLAVRSDPVLVERILRNLVSNAIRYTDRGKVLIGCRARAKSVAVEIWDTGPGIADQAGAYLRWFYQATARPAQDWTGAGNCTSRREFAGHRSKPALRSRAWNGIPLRSTTL